MRVSEFMSRDVVSCPTTSSLVDPARAMWDKDVGFVPIVDAATGAIAGVMTDRDICMAALTQGRPLHEIPVRDVMQTNFYACSDQDNIARVHAIMRDHKLRRVPVLDGAQHVVGVVSFNDFARHADRAASKGLRDAFIKTAGSICEPRVIKRKETWPDESRVALVEV